jgi:hypothetical protein
MSTTAFPPDLNLGPLTTTFTKPPGCFDVSLATMTPSSGVIAVVGALYTPSSCYPSGKLMGSDYTTSTKALYRDHDEHIYFSPGICPSGWGQYPVSTATTNGTAYTTAFCCPAGFTQITTTSVTGGDNYWRCYTLNNLPTTISGWRPFDHGFGGLFGDPVFIK